MAVLLFFFAILGNILDYFDELNFIKYQPVPPVIQSAIVKEIIQNNIKQSVYIRQVVGKV